MSLINRLSVFFLSSLAVVLAGFSLSLYLLVRAHLESQLNERLDTAMNVLVSAVEIHPKDVQWEPLERHIVLGESSSLDQPRWALHDLSGRLRDRSQNLAMPHGSEGDLPRWRMLTRRLRAGSFSPEEVDGQIDRVEIDRLDHTALGNVSASALPDDRTFTADGLIITLAVNRGPIDELLQWLAVAVSGISAAIWLCAALFGRWLCRRMLRPITQIAESARRIRNSPVPTQSLEVPATRDELEDLGRAFNELLTELHESLERQTRFAGDASHQLRTPLTALLTSVDVTLRQERSPDDYKKTLEVVRRRGGQLCQIIDTLLFLARAEEGTLPGLPERTNLNAWCRTWLESWSDHVRAGDVSLRQASDDAAAVVTTRPALLGQVLDNLLDNAFKYSEPGTPVEVAVDVAMEHVTVSVNDTGRGIAADQRESIFQPFYRTPDATWRGTVGVGLGLAVAQRLTNILGGKLEVASELGKGSRFSIQIPRSEMSASR